MPSVIHVNGELRYVGCSVTPLARYATHYRATLGMESTHVWIRCLKQLGLEPVLVVLESTENYKNANKLEVVWTNKIKQRGHRLLNRATGGYHLKTVC
jgi:hypothetical protein